MPWKPSSVLGISARASLFFLALLSMTSCAGQRIGDPEQRSAWAQMLCLTFSPIYLDEADIAGLSDEGAGKIAEHNAVWEGFCA